MRPVKFAIFFAGVAVLAALALYAGVQDVAKTLTALGWGGFFLITFLHLLVIAAMGAAWWWVARSGARAARYIAARWVRDSVAEVLPFSQIGGYVSGARAASLGGISQSALSMFADLVVEFAAKLVYVLAAIICLVRLLPGGTTLVFALLAVVAVAFSGFLLAGLYRARLKQSLEYWARKLMKRWMPGAEIRLDLGDYFRWRRLWPCFLIHLGCWFFGALEAWITLRWMGVRVSGGEALVIDSLATSLRAVGFMVPGALGVQEGGYVLVSLLFGIVPAQAIAFSLARRARDLAIGVPGLALWQFLEARALRGPAKQN